MVLIGTLIDAWTTSFEPTHNEKVLGHRSFAIARSQAGPERSSPPTVFMLDQPCWCVRRVGRNMTHDAPIHNELTREMAREGRVLMICAFNSGVGGCFPGGTAGLGSGGRRRNGEEGGITGLPPVVRQADAFLKAVGSARITVFPSIVRIMGGETSYAPASQKEIVRLLKDNGLGSGEALERNSNRGNWRVNSQLRGVSGQYGRPWEGGRQGKG